MHPIKTTAFPIEMAIDFIDTKRLWNLSNGLVIKGEMVIEILSSLSEIKASDALLAELRAVVLAKDGKGLSTLMQKTLKSVLQFQGALKSEVQEFLKECFNTSSYLQYTLPEKYISTDLEYHPFARL